MKRLLATLILVLIVARTQTAPVIGFLNGQSVDTYAHLLAAFRRGLWEMRFVNGQNAVVEYRWAEGQDDRLSTLATELVGRDVSVGQHFMLQ